MESVRKGLRIAAAAAVAVGLTTGTAGASSAHKAASCGSFHVLINGGGTTISQLTGAGMSCGTAHKVARAWAYGFDHHNGDQYCAPRAQDGPHICHIGRYRCRATGVSGASADVVSCSWRSRRVSWRADFDQNPQPDGENVGLDGSR